MRLGKNKKNNDNIKTFFNGTWKEVKLIGEGSYGKVYKAKKEEFGAVTYSAIKQIEIPNDRAEISTLKKEGMTQKDITTYFEETVSKWVEEINFMSSFKDSENVVSIEDYEVLPNNKEIGWTINIKMELLQNLEDYVYEHNITDKDILKMAIDVTNALEDCEENNVVHRDIKPDNIFVNKKGVYKVGDFGIAKRIETSASNMSRKGTDNYMAPELYKNERGNKTVDIYSLGIMLYRFFNYNRLPFLPDYPDKITPDARENALYMRITGEKMKPPVNAPRDIAEIILKACNYYSKDRYQTASELKTDLERIYQRITKPTVLFNYNEKQMDKLYKENTKSYTHNATVSVLTGTKANNEIQEKSTISVDKEKPAIEISKETKIEKATEVVKTENYKEKNIDTESDKKIKVKKEEKEIKIEQEKAEKPVKVKKEKIKREKVKNKNNKNKIIIAIILLLIIVLILFLILRKPKETYITVPNVIKLESNIGSEMLTKEGLVIEYEYVETDNEAETNHIISQSIDANTKTKKGSLIKLKVAVSKEQVEVINVVGMTKEEASNKLKGLGLNVNIIEQNSDIVGVGKVISQMTDAGTKVNKGTVIELLVSKGKEEKKETNTQTKQKNWSDWVSSLPAGVNASNYNIETKKQYRSSTRTTKTVTEKDYRGDIDTEISDTNTAGWTVYDKKVEKVFGNTIWDQMSESQLNYYSSLDYYKLVSSERTFYAVQGITCWKGGAWKNSSEFTTPIIINSNVTCPAGYSATDVANARYVKVKSDYMPKIGSVVTGNYVVNGLNNFDITLYVTNAENGYTTHEQWLDYTLTTYYYEKWSDFSNWQDNVITTNANTKVEERTIYRYKEK